MDQLRILLETSGVWLVCVLPGIALGRILAKKGIIRDQPIAFALEMLFVVFAGRFLNKVSETPWYYYVAGSIILFLGIYRYEYGNTRHWGRWWWLREAEITGGRKKPLNPWLKGYIILTTFLSLALGIAFIIWCIITIFR